MTKSTQITPASQQIVKSQNQSQMQTSSPILLPKPPVVNALPKKTPSDLLTPEEYYIEFENMDLSDENSEMSLTNTSNMKFDESQNEEGGDEGKEFECRHCGKRYRWKSTLRRHERVECGGKAPSYDCPYCSYKAKQKGNLGVHLRKHHPDLPSLTPEKRGRHSSRT